MAAIGNGHHAHLQAQLSQQMSLLTGQLFQQLAAHIARPQNEQVHLLHRSLEKGFVQHIHGFANVGGPNHRRDILLRSALRNGPNVHPVVPQRAKELAANARVVFHILAHQRHDGQPFFRSQALDAAGRNFRGKLLIHRHLGRRGILLIHAHANGMLRRALGNEDHVDTLPRQGRKQPHREARNAYHTAALQVQQGQVANAGDALYHGGRARRLYFHQRAVVIRGEGIFNPERDARTHHRLDGGRVEHLRPEVRQLHGFLIRNAGNGPRRPH